MPRRPLWRRLLPLVVLAAIAGLIISQGWHNLISFQQLALNQQALQAWIGENLIGALAVYMPPSMSSWWRFRCPAARC